MILNQITRQCGPDGKTESLHRRRNKKGSRWQYVTKKIRVYQRGRPGEKSEAQQKITPYNQDSSKQKRIAVLRPSFSEGAQIEEKERLSGRTRNLNQELYSTLKRRGKVVKGKRQ